MKEDCYEIFRLIKNINSYFTCDIKTCKNKNKKCGFIRWVKTTVLLIIYFPMIFVVLLFFIDFHQNSKIRSLFLSIANFLKLIIITFFYDRIREYFYFFLFVWHLITPEFKSTVSGSECTIRWLIIVESSELQNGQGDEIC